MINPLELPKTLRLAKPEDLPANFPQSKFDDIKNANIVEGYKLHYKNDNPEHSNLPFSFFCEINVDNTRLWDLVLLLSDELPEDISLIFGHIDAEPIYGNYVNKEYLLDFLSKYTYELTQDTFIYFGLIYNDENVLTEIFIDESKYIKYWGTGEISFRDKLSEFNLKENDNLNFIDEFPKVRESLASIDKKALSSTELIDLLSLKFK